MLSPNPLSLLCAILLSLPLALVFTISSNFIPHHNIVFHPKLTVTPPRLPPPTKFIRKPPNIKAENTSAKNSSQQHYLSDTNNSTPSQRHYLNNTKSSSIPKKQHHYLNDIKTNNSSQKHQHHHHHQQHYPTDTNNSTQSQQKHYLNNTKDFTKSQKQQHYLSSIKNSTHHKTKTTIIKPKKNLPPPPPPPRRPPPKDDNTTIIKPKKNLPPPPPPSPPPHPPQKDDKDDVELLRQASRVNPIVDLGNSPKRIAFLFLTTTPLPFAPLWELFFNQTNNHQKHLYNIYIHTDPKLANYTGKNPPSTGAFKDRIIPILKPTRRNTPTLISAARRLLAHALLDDPSNYMFTLLSGACIPLHSFNFTYNTLISSNKSFIEILNNETTAYGRWAARGDHAMLPEIPLEIFRIGSQFWSLTRHHARVVVEDVMMWRKFRLPCVTLDPCFPEENYFPTLLSVKDPRGVVPATLTNVNWRGSHNGHPRTYNGSEVEPGLIRWLRETRPRYGDLGFNGSEFRWDPFLFARKFSPNCLEPLLSLANDYLFKD